MDAGGKNALGLSRGRVVTLLKSSFYGSNSSLRGTYG
jgi:hypothetical protein